MSHPQAPLRWIENPNRCARIYFSLTYVTKEQTPPNHHVEAKHHPRGGVRPEHYQRIELTGNETTADLIARGVPERTARTAVKRGWYTLKYHHPQYPQDDGEGHFSSLENPYAFATAQVRHVIHTHLPTGIPPEDFEDTVQDALVWAWERRHCQHIEDFPAYISTGVAPH